MGSLFQQVMDYDRYVINDDRVAIEVKSSMEPHPVSGSGDGDFGYQVMKNSIRQVWTEAVVAPGTLLLFFILFNLERSCLFHCLTSS